LPIGFNHVMKLYDTAVLTDLQKALTFRHLNPSSSKIFELIQLISIFFFHSCVVVDLERELGFLVCHTNFQNDVSKIQMLRPNWLKYFTFTCVSPY
jgi:hypothetical protein